VTVPLHENKKLFPYPLISSLFGSAVLVAFALWYGIQNSHSSLMTCFFIAAVAFPLFQGITLWRGLKIGEKNFFGFAKIEMFGLIFTQLGIIAVTQLYGGQYVGVFLVFVIAPVIINLFMLYRLRHFLVDKGLAEDGIVPHGLKSSFYASFYIASNYVDKLLLFFFITPASLAFFAAADRLSELLRAGVQDVATALAPRFAETKYYSKRLDLYLKSFCFVFGIFMMIFAFTALPHVVELIYGSAYSDATVYAQILIFSAAVVNLSSMQFRYIRSQLDIESFRKIIVWTSLMRVAISVVLIYFFGIKGAIGSVLIYRIGFTLYTNYVIRRDYQDPSRIDFSS
jgi:O-antigen/teichoic acid export membrane protein